jgi:hypothetical protein
MDHLNEKRSWCEPARLRRAGKHFDQGITGEIV